MRVRPLSEQEAEKGPAWKIDSNKILPLAQGSSSDLAYTLDNVFGSEWTTREVYDRTTEDIIKKVILNTAMFAFQQYSDFLYRSSLCTMTLDSLGLTL